MTIRTTSVESSIKFSSILYEPNFFYHRLKKKNVKNSNILNAYKWLKNQYNILKKYDIKEMPILTAGKNFKFLRIILFKL